METSKTPVKKTYFSRIPGSHYTFADGHKVHFDFGRFNFDPDDFSGPFLSAHPTHSFNGKPKAQVYFDELEYLVNSGNPLVFQQGTNPVDAILPSILDPKLNAKSEGEIATENARMVATGRIKESGDQNTPATGTVSDPNASAVDHDLRARLLTDATGPGAGKAAQLRAEAIARTQTQHANMKQGQ